LGMAHPARFERATP